MQLESELRDTKNENELLWKDVFEVLIDNNVLLFDQRDHGDSSVEDGRVSLGTREYRDVIASVDWLMAWRYQGSSTWELQAFTVAYN
mgnify:CR=1 FL=1